MEQQVTQSGSTTTTIYIANLEQVSTTGSTTTTTTYYYVGGARIALAANGTFSYLASDGLGTANVALNSTGTATASTLLAPYGGGRYSAGTMPTDYGFTGQHMDATSGLDYYRARYYDPLVGQFTTADRVLPGGGFDILGLSRYAYVEGNPETLTDPSGNTSCRTGNGCHQGWSGEDDPATAAQSALLTVIVAIVYLPPATQTYRTNTHISQQERPLVDPAVLDALGLNWHHDPLATYHEDWVFERSVFAHYNHVPDLQRAFLLALGVGGESRLGGGGDERATEPRAGANGEAPNGAASDAMAGILARRIPAGMDCSEIACNLFDAAGRRGEILHTEPQAPGLNLRIGVEGLLTA